MANKKVNLFEKSIVVVCIMFRFFSGSLKTTEFHVASPCFFVAALLSKAKQYADSHPEQPKLITINAWNEWVEGSYLLPDMLNGFGYLEAVKEVINGEFDIYTDK